MKKLLLSLMAVAMVGSSAMADVTPQVSLKKFDAPAKERVMKKAPLQAQSRAESGFDLRFCGDPYTWYGLNNTDEFRLFITIPAEIATQLAGNKVTSIGLSVAFASSTAKKQGQICVWEDVNADPAVSKSVSITDSYSKTNYYQVLNFDADNQYVIKENTPFSFGFITPVDKNTYPMCIDGYAAGEFCGTMQLYYKGKLTGEYSVGDPSTGISSNAFLFATTEGEKTELNDVFTAGLAPYNFTYPIFNNTDPMLCLTVDNFGSNTLTSAEYTYSVNGGEPQTATATIEVPGCTTGVGVALPVGNVPQGPATVSATLSKVNGKDVSSSFAGSFISLGESDGYARKFVVEEGTGTWCGWCPRGIVGFEYMEETYPEDFVGIAVHSGDTFEPATYTSFIDKYFDGFPSCVVNRDNIFNLDPDASMLEYAHYIWAGQKSLASVNLRVSNDETILYAVADVEFALDIPDADYSLAFVVLEDGLVAKQSNYYAGGSYGDMGGWGSKGSSVQWTYKHTARAIYDAFGIKGSIPTNITAGETYSYVEPITVSTKILKDVKNSAIVALLLENTSGTVMNAAEVKYVDYETAGIEDITTDNQGEAVYYNIQGLQVKNPREGELYIRVNGKKAEKVIF